jgi:methylmalonyl-CoA mutase C-terminal domain/subunit
MAKEGKVRVLMAKPGVDGHWRGMLVVTLALRDAGMEVIYGGNMPPEHIASIVAQEDVDVVGLSIMTGSPVILSSETIKELKKVGRGNVLVIVGGIITDDDVPVLQEVGVGGVFRTGTPLEHIVEFVHKHISATQ